MDQKNQRSDCYNEGKYKMKFISKLRLLLSVRGNWFVELTVLLFIRTTTVSLPNFDYLQETEYKVQPIANLGWVVFVTSVIKYPALGQMRPISGVCRKRGGATPGVAVFLGSQINMTTVNAMVSKYLSSLNNAHCVMHLDYQ